jgi:hypothetical protein
MTTAAWGTVGLLVPSKRVPFRMTTVPLPFFIAVLP